MVVIPSSLEATQPCKDLMNDDCADGKLHCRPTVTKNLRAPIDGFAIINEVITKLIKRDPDQTEFHQAAREVLESLVPVIEANPEFADNSLLECIVEPERTISFRVPWTDDSGVTHVNRFDCDTTVNVFIAVSIPLFPRILTFSLSSSLYCNASARAVSASDNHL